MLLLLRPPLLPLLIGAKRQWDNKWSVTNWHLIILMWRMQLKARWSVLLWDWLIGFKLHSLSSNSSYYSMCWLCLCVSNCICFCVIFQLSIIIHLFSTIRHIPFSTNTNTATTTTATYTVHFTFFTFSFLFLSIIYLHTHMHYLVLPSPFLSCIALINNPDQVNQIGGDECCDLRALCVCSLQFGGVAAAIVVV